MEKIKEFYINGEKVECYYLKNRYEIFTCNFKGLYMFFYGNENEINSKGEWGYYIDSKREGKIIYWDKEIGVTIAEYEDGICNGKMLNFFKDGNREESTYVAGIRNGASKYIWKDDGFEERSYKDGKKEGKATRFFKNGSKEDINYKNDKVNGKSIYYFVDGVYEERNYVDGDIIGDGTLYFLNGQTLNIFHKNEKNEDDLKININIFENILEKLNMKIESLEKEIKKLRENTNNNIYIEYKKENSIDIYGRKQGEWIEKNYNFIEEGEYRDNKRVGKWNSYRNNELLKISYYNNGVLISEEAKNSGVLEYELLKWQVDEKGNKQGEWIERRFEKLILKNKILQTRIVISSNYVDNILNGSCKKYYPNGNIFEESNYINGKKSGLFIIYNDYGEVETLGNYVNGNKEGKWIEQEGEGEYLNGKKEGIWNLKNGLKKTYKNGLIIGKYFSYYSTGEIKAVEEYIDLGEKKREEQYYKNGKLKSKCDYIYDFEKEKYIKVIESTEEENMNEKLK